MPNLEQGPYFKEFMSEWNAEHPEGAEKPAEKPAKQAPDQKAVEEAFFEAGNIKEAAAKLDLERLRKQIKPKEFNPPALAADRKAMSALKPDATALKESKGFFARMLEKVGIKQETVAEREAKLAKQAEKKYGPVLEEEERQPRALRKSEFGSKQTLEEAEAEQTFKNLEKAAKWQKKADRGEKI